MTEEIIEQLAQLEHNQWWAWSKALSEDLHKIKSLCYIGKTTEAIQLINTLLSRWEKNWDFYQFLSNEVKEKDRVYAKKVALCIKEKLQEHRFCSELHEIPSKDDVDQYFKGTCLFMIFKELGGNYEQ